MFGGLAQLARAPALQAGGQRFESVILHLSAARFARMRRARDLWHIGTRQNKTVDKKTQQRHIFSNGRLHVMMTCEQATSCEKVIKGAWRMPWLTEAMKDVISCEKWRVGANIPWSVNLRMGQPSSLKGCYPVFTGGKRGELKHLSTRRKRK